MPPFNVISISIPEIVLSWENLLLFKFYKQVGKLDHSRYCCQEARHELARLAMGTIFLVIIIICL